MLTSSCMFMGDADVMALTRTFFSASPAYDDFQNCQSALLISFAFFSSSKALFTQVLKVPWPPEKSKLRHYTLRNFLPSQLARGVSGKKGPYLFAVLRFHDLNRVWRHRIPIRWSKKVFKYARDHSGMLEMLRKSTEQKFACQMKAVHT